MKNKTLITLLLFISLGAKGDYWTQKASFPGASNNLAFCFSIATKGYFGCGRDSNLQAIKSFWEYDQPSNIWTQKADFGGTPRSSVIGFSVLGKGYAGLGIDSASYLNSDLWEFNPAGNSWLQKTSLPGLARQQASAFVIAGKAYITCGLNIFPNYLNDLWQYNPTIDTWQQKANLPGLARLGAGVTSVDSMGYLIAGYFYNGQTNFLQDCWSYNTLSDSWTQLANFPGLPRCQAAAFTIGMNVYFGTGSISFTCEDDFWQYIPTQNLWTQKATFGGMARDEASYFSIGNKGYIGLGYQNGAPYFNDFWEYTPDSTTGIEEEFAVSGLAFTVAPNPAKEFTVCSFLFTVQKNTTLTVTNVTGKKVFSTRITTSNYKLQTSNYPAGIYTIKVDNGQHSVVKKFVKQ